MKLFQLILGAVLMAASSCAAAPSEPPKCTEKCLGPKIKIQKPENCDRYNRVNSC
ncbi:unnamed protein product [Cercospora beticola]|nr:unnamed protein product [Cercospora beticola]